MQKNPPFHTFLSNLTEQLQRRRDSYSSSQPDRIEDEPNNSALQNVLIEEIIEKMPAGVILAEAPSGKVLFANSEVEKVFRQPLRKSQPMQNHTEWTGFKLNGRPLLPREWPLARALLSGETINHDEIKILRGDQTLGTISVCAAPIYGRGGDLIAAVCSFYDITDKKQIEDALRDAKNAAEAASAAKTTFLTNMSHEMRTPLGVVMGHIELMNMPSQSQEEKESSMLAIHRNLNILTKLIDELLDLSEFEAGRLTVENMEFSLSLLMQDVLSLVQFKAEEKGLMINLFFESDVPSDIISDPSRLRQILLHLLGNALKFTEHGSLSIRVKYSKPLLIFEVADTGVGMTAEQAVTLFQPFTQVDSSLTRAFGGSGLGLALSRRLARMLGGDVRLDRTGVNQGSVFVLHAPVKEAAKATPIHAMKSTNSKHLGLKPKHRLSGRKILLVDDSPDNRTLISRLLQIEGANIETANDGAEGLRRALHGTYDLVLMDLQMPKMDGYSATEHLRANGFTQPILALTANAVREERLRCIAAGCNDHMAKPVLRDDLIEKISSLLPPNRSA